ncbi:MAG: M14 family metallopeptidase [Elusimicrobia bacterium]|nr:M14 family metallopeptidase [Elusimicrobiota bacterium]
MKKILLPLLFTAVSALPSFAAETPSSYEQLLKHITTPPAGDAAYPAAQASARQADGRYWVTIKAADKAARTSLLEQGFDIIEVDRKGGTVSGIAGPELMDHLSSKSFSVIKRVPLAEYSSTVSKDFPAADAIYHNYKETTDLLKELASKNSDIASLFSIGKTVEGRDIWCLRINPSAKGEAASSKPGAFFLGNVHAREHLADEVPLLFAAWLMDHRNDADIKKYISTLDIYIIPMGNPDGVEFDIKTGSYQYFRKNMAKNSNGSRGVDLNRNFDSWWCQAGASNYPGSDTYCGPKAFSEPESQHIRDFMLARRNIRTHISYHSYASEILYPYGGSDSDVPNAKDKQAFIKHAGEMGKLTGYEPIKSSDMYIATGDSCDWAYDATGALAFTFELEGRGFYPGAAIVKGAVERNIKAAVYLLSVTDDPYRGL